MTVFPLSSLRICSAILLVVSRFVLCNAEDGDHEFFYLGSVGSEAALDEAVAPPGSLSLLQVAATVFRLEHNQSDNHQAQEHLQKQRKHQRQKELKAALHASSIAKNTAAKHKTRVAEAPEPLNKHRHESSRILGVFIGGFGGFGGGLAATGSPFGGLAGIVGGSFFGLLGGVLVDYVTESKDNVDGFEVIEPVGMKLNKLAIAVVAIDTYLNNQESVSAENHAIYEAGLEEAKHLFEPLQADANASADNHGDLSAFEEDFHELEEIIAADNISFYLTADVAAEDDLLVTGNDVAGMEGVRAEDDNEGAFEGDMIPSNISQLALFQDISAGHSSFLSAGRPWTGGVVKYCYASDVPPTVSHIFEAAAREYTHAIPCLRFVNVGWVSGSSTTAMKEQRCAQSPAIFVTSNPAEGCFAYVGMIPQFVSQRVQLKDKACTSLGTVIHEIGHALGMAHEQARPDRDKYIRVNRQNIKPGFEHNFAINRGAYVSEHYDFRSIMHYDAFAFAKNPNFPTIQEKSQPGHTAAEMGQRTGLAESDARQVAQSYLPENPTCSAVAMIKRRGCIDALSATGVATCKGLTACSGSSIDACCACGGGVKIQCYAGSPCPTAYRLPKPAGAECINDVTAAWNGQYQCAFQNVCSYAVKWKCPKLPCTHQASAHGYYMNTCQGYAQTEICAAKDTCTIWKV